MAQRQDPLLHIDYCLTPEAERIFEQVKKDEEDAAETEVVAEAEEDLLSFSVGLGS